MRSPENVLKSLSEKAKNKDYRYERLYRNLYNPEFYLLAYQNIATSQGSMTAGADGLTLDGMSMERIEKLIAKLRDHSYQPNPARRVYIAKKNSNKKRPLGIPSTDDKLLQEVVRMILEAIYEPTFSDNSHGFRPKRSCHTALKEIVTLFTGAKWIIEGDIKACFDSFDHHITIQLLRKRIKDEAFISLMWKFLRAGYMEQWTYNGCGMEKCSYICRKKNGLQNCMNTEHLKSKRTRTAKRIGNRSTEGRLCHWMMWQSSASIIQKSGVCTTITDWQSMYAIWENSILSCVAVA